MLSILRQSGADIICLQEVMPGLFPSKPSSDAAGGDFARQLSSMGYGWVLQHGKRCAKSRAVNLTLWKADAFSLTFEDHRSRTLVTVLTQKSSSRRLAVCNCHLQGDPRSTTARVRQLSQALRFVGHEILIQVPTLFFLWGEKMCFQKKALSKGRGVF